MTLEEIRAKYNDMFRDEMDTDTQINYVNDLFDMYEAEGFSKVFWSNGGDMPEYIGKTFEVLGRTPMSGGTEKNGADISDLPMWRIKFDDGNIISAYPDEIVLSEMKEFGYKSDEMDENDDCEDSDKNGKVFTEEETFQTIEKACDIVNANIAIFRKNMLEQSTQRCYDEAFYIFCAEQVAYYFDEHVGMGMFDDEKLEHFDAKQLSGLIVLNKTNLTAPLIVQYIYNQDAPEINNMDEVENSVKNALEWMSKCADNPEADIGRIDERYKGLWK